MNYKNEIDKRVKNRLKRSLFDVNTQLEHFAIISYKVPLEKIKHLIPKPFKLWTFNDKGVEYALISAVPFKDKDFTFHKICNYPKFNFFQTNFRTYIIDERTQNHCAWFFGTTLGSLTSFIPKKIWKMPWEYGKYAFEFTLKKNNYSKYIMKFSSKQGKGFIDIENSGNKMKLLQGFNSIEEQILILTHPVIGYYKISKHQLGTYEIWHPEIKLQEGKSNKLYFELFEKLGLLTKDEMKNPHSILTIPEIEFDILLPPRKDT